MRISSFEIPNSWSAWDYNLIVKLVEHHEFEPSRLDFKEAFNPRDAQTNEAKKSLVRSIRHTAIAMANRDGGYIIFGVQDRGAGTESAVKRIVGIESPGDFGKHFGDRVKNIQPQLRFDPMPSSIPLPHPSSRVVCVVQIPKSDDPRHMDEETGSFHIRSDGGTNEPMTWRQVHDLMVTSEERIADANLFVDHLREFKRQADWLYRQQQGMGNSIDRFDVDLYQSLFASIRVLIATNVNLSRHLQDINQAAKSVNNLLDEYRRTQKGLAFYTDRSESKLLDISRWTEEAERDLRAMIPQINRK